MKKPKKYQAGGVAGGNKKAPDIQGAWIDVQKRTLNQKAKSGAKIPSKNNKRGT